MMNRIIAAIVSIAMLFSGVATYSPHDAENIRLSFVATADTHIESNNFERLGQFAGALKDMGGASRRNDAMVICGDITMNGQLVEYICFSAMLALFNKSENTLLAMGNHEIFTAENGYDRGFAKFNAFSNVISGNKTGKPYYYDVINDYYFIMLGSEKDMGVQAYISPEQLLWLDETVAQATKTGLPAFVFCHFPLEGTTNNSWGVIGEQSADIYEILQKYQNVFYFSGHQHNSVDYCGVKTIGNVTFTDLPSLLCGAVQGEINEIGTGYQVEVYDDRIELRPRCYAENGKWLTEHDVTIKLRAQ